MRILFLTNFYPPHELGGQGQSCQQVVEGMKRRGHSTLVLTSMHGTDNVAVEADGVSRSLYLEMDLVPWRQSLTFFTSRQKREQHNLQRLDQVLAEFGPDVVFIWGMWNMPRSVPALAEARCPGKVVYRFADYWPTLPSQHEFYWRATGRNWLAKLPKRMLGYVALAMLAGEGQRPALKFEHAICVSAATRRILVEAGIPVSHARIIHTGLDIERYVNGAREARPRNRAGQLDLLYAGRLSPEKGVDTTIKALGRLVHGRGLKQVRLSLAGSGAEDYEGSLRQLVAREKLEEHVTFLGRVPTDEMPGLLRRFDVLIVPSTWPEPFARIVLEGMVCGLAVVATPTGGTGEIIVNEENGLLFAPGDDEDLARQLATLAADPPLQQRLAEAGRQTVTGTFTIGKMMTEIESYLQEIALLPASAAVEAA